MKKIRSLPPQLTVLRRLEVYKTCKLSRIFNLLVQPNCTSFQAAKFRRDCASELTNVLYSVLATAHVRYTLVIAEYLSVRRVSTHIGSHLAAARQVKQAEWQLTICCNKSRLRSSAFMISIKKK